MFYNIIFEEISEPTIINFSLIAHISLTYVHF